MKYCPFQSKNKEKTICDNECALFDEDLNICAIKTTAKFAEYLDNIDSEITNIKDKIKK